jgi:beta-lactamase regulating signal transducer with metallopeptidase domain
MPELAKIVFLNFLTVSLIAGVLIAVVMAVTPWLNKRYLPRWRYYVWLALALWLIAPVTLPINQTPLILSVPDIQLTRGVVPDRGSLSEDNTIYTDNTLYTDSAVRTDDASVDNVMSSDSAPASLPGIHEPAPALDGLTQVLGTNNRTAAFPVITLLDLLIAFWLLGLVIYLSVRWIALLRFQASLRRAWRLCDSVETTAFVRRTMAEMGFHIEMDIRISKTVRSPFATGLIHPVLVLPEQEYDPNLLVYVIRHELTHCKRRDLWYKLLVDLANAVHWFNPLVWMMNHAGGRDLELVCDELVIRGQDSARRREYGESILYTVKRRKNQQMPMLTTSFSNGVKDLQQRFENIMATPVRRSGAFCSVLAVSLIVLLGSAIQVTPGTDQNPGSRNAADGTSASGIGVGSGDRAIRLEGENHAAINHKVYYTPSSKASNEKFLHIYNTVGPAEGYLIAYEFTAAHTGLYQMEICSTPHTAAWTSSYEYSVNGGSFVIVNNDNASEIGVVDKWFRRYTLFVGLEAGTNTITFRVARPRLLDNDGYYTFFLDYIELIPMDRVGTRLEGENPESLNHNVFYGASPAASEGRFLQIHNTIGPAEGYLINYEVTVAQGGAKWMEVCASPHTTGWTSPWEVSVNGGAFVLADDNSAGTGTLVNALFTRYTMPVTLREGANTITIRVAQRRSMDDNYLFYLDYLEIYD